MGRTPAWIPGLVLRLEGSVLLCKFRILHSLILIFFQCHHQPLTRQTRQGGRFLRLAYASMGFFIIT